MASSADDLSSKSTSEPAPPTDCGHEDMSPPTPDPAVENDSESESGEDASSDSSSVVHDWQESFSTFQSRVKKLILETLWSDANEADVLIERLKGGGYNRIIGITRHITDEPTHDVQYILRLPRFSYARLDRDVANLQFLQRYSTIPAPTVIAFDTNTDNQVQGPYMIQNRIVGTDMLVTFPKLTHEDKCRVARDVGGVVNQMLALRSDAAGALTFKANEVGLDAAFYVGSFPSVNEGFPGCDEEGPEQEPVPYRKAHTSRPALELLTERFQKQKENSLRTHPTEDFEPMIMDAFCTMASELDADGWLSNLPNCLAHLDFEPRNILIDPASAPEGPIVTAVLDWDSAILAPIFMACTPPFWIWGWLDDEDEDERKANDDPPDANNRQLKQIFETAAGKEYVHFAYGPVYRLARALLHFAIHGLHSNEDYRESWEMLTEWRQVRPETSAPGTQSCLGEGPWDADWWVVESPSAALGQMSLSTDEGNGEVQQN